MPFVAENVSFPLGAIPRKTHILKAQPRLGGGLRCNRYELRPGIRLQRSRPRTTGSDLSKTGDELNVAENVSFQCRSVSRKIVVRNWHPGKDDEREHCLLVGTT